MLRFSLRTLIVLCFFISPVNLSGQESGSIAGRVETMAGQPIPRAVVTVIETSSSTRTGSDGAFLFGDLPPGTYNLLIESSRFGAHSRAIDVVAGEVASPVISIDIGVHAEEIFVSASPEGRAASEVYQPIAVLSSQDLLEQSEASLGETLNKEPGVSSTYFGPGSSRPIVRGLGGDRIRILEDGIGVGDASNVSPDHATTTDPLSAERIEIIRGPATLLYGSAAVGGVVNVLDDSIPDRLPVEAVTGSVDLVAGTVADERTGSVKLDGGLGSIAWHVDYLTRQTDDYEIPGPAEEEHGEEENGEEEDHEEEPFDGFLENSSLDTESGTFGASWIFSRGFAGISVNRYETNYGIPGHGHGHGHEEEESEEEEEEESVRVDMKQTRFDFRGGLDFDGFVKNVKLRAGTTDYEHDELEGSEVGTHFENDSWEARIEAVHQPLGPIKGAFGVQVSRRDFLAEGEEAFVPPSETDMNAVFLFEEMNRGAWSFQAGARWEQQDVSTSAEDLPDRSFDGLSASLGALWKSGGPLSIAISAAHSERLPTAEELYSNGPHAATSSFEIGDPFLEKESGLSGDLTFRMTTDDFKGEITFFRTEFSDFVYLQPTGTEQDELPVFVYQQNDARFHGLEFQGHYDLFHWDPHHLEIELGGDWVDGQLESGANLPRIAPMRLFTGLLYEADKVFGRVEVRHVFEQDEVADLEEPTDGYTLVSANLGYRFLLGETSHLVMLRGRNLTDELARSHVSPLKEVAPLPGRDLSIAWRVIF